jgi:DNA-binding PadR family transcriptional regulator
VSTRNFGSSIAVMPTAPRSSPLALTVLALLHYQPLHPYGIQRLIKQWGKDQVVNVEQRTSLYRTIERLLAAGLIAVRETERDPRYPERTVYEITGAGRQTARRWLEEMLAEPRQEYPEFPAALSHVLMLEPAELADVLDRRAQRLSRALAAFEANAAAEAEQGLPRIATLEAEYQRAVLDAEASWVQSVIADLRSGKLTWSREELLAFAENQG